jgi:hypothetical protein
MKKEFKFGDTSAKFNHPVTVANWNKSGDEE